MPTPPPFGSLTGLDGYPKTTIKIDGTTIGVTDVNMGRYPFKAWERNGLPSIRISRRGGAFPGRPDPWSGKEMQVFMDFGHGDHHVFTGDVWDLDPRHDTIGVIYEYMAVSLRDRMDRIPITNDNDGTMSFTWNALFDGSNFIEGRSGRTGGQMIIELLETETIATQLQAYGVGNYVTTGSGASATAVIAGSSVTGFTGLIGGSGYTSPPTAILIGGGGSGATATVSLSGGVVSAVNVVNSGTGYTSPPTLVISRLPYDTLKDLGTFSVIPPSPKTASGEKFGTALDGLVKELEPNAFMHVMPDGTIRFFDLRNFGTTEVSVSGDGTGAKAAALVLSGEIVEIFVINPGRDYTSASVSVTDSGTGTGCTATVTIGTVGNVQDITVTNPGSDYGGAKIVLTIDAEIDLPSVKQTLRTCFERLVIRGANYIEPTRLSLADGTLLKDYGHDGMDPTEAESVWKRADFFAPDTDAGVAKATATLEGKPITTTATIQNAGSGGTPGTYAATISGGGGTGATANYVIDGSGHLSSITIVNQGSGYTVAPFIAFPLGSITGATATTSMPARAVASLHLDNGGYGYHTADVISVSFSGGGGTGATAHVSITEPNIDSITLDSGGTGYTTPPTVVIGGSFTATTDNGTCTCTNTLNVVVKSAFPARQWAANTWDFSPTGRHGLIYLTSGVITGVNVSVTRRVVACGSLSAGGTCTLTLDQPLPSLDYSTYVMRGTGGGATDVYRLYKPADDAVAAAMTNSPWSIAGTWHSKSGTSATLTSRNTCSVSHGGQELAMAIEVDVTAKGIRTALPVLELFGTRSLLEKGGSFVDGIPDDVVMLIGVNKGTLRAICPPDAGSPPSPQYAGTAHTVEGRSDTKYVQVNDWREPSNQTNMDTWACNLLDAFKDTKFDGSFKFDGLFVPALFPGAVISFDIENGGPTGWESFEIPLSSCEINWPGNALIHDSTIGFSNQKIPISESMILTPPQVGVPIGAASSSDFPGLSSLGGDFVGNTPNVSTLNASVPEGETPWLKTPTF